MTGVREAGHWPISEWPAFWRAKSQPESRSAVALGCGCAVSFADPAPGVGSTVNCRWHGAAIVVDAESDRTRCAGINDHGQPCGQIAGAGETFCWHHRA